MNLRIKEFTMWNRNAAVVGLSAMALLTFSISAKADLGSNGNFETASCNFNCTTQANGQIGYNTTLTGWSANGGYNFLYASGTSNSHGANGDAGYVGMDSAVTATPNGDNFVALDSDYGTAALTQTINGLTSGDSYTVSFYWGGAQQAGFSGVTSDYLKVGFGSSTQNTSTVNNTSQGFTGWSLVTDTFTASGTSDVLSFLAASPSGGEPPFVLLDGVSVNALVATPEVGSLTLLFTVLGLAVGLGSFKSKNWLKKS